MNQARRKTDWLLWAMTLPFFILVLLFNYVPLAGWSMAFVKYIPGLSIYKSEFAGLDYFRQIFSLGSELPKAITNTLALGFLGMLTAPLPMLLAILISEVGRIRMRKFIQVALSLPNFISFIIVYSIFFTFFSVDGGFINQIMLKLHLISEPTNLLGNESATWLFQTLVIVWKSMGWSAIIYIGAITSIDTQLYDAASVDGAGRFKKAMHVTLPGLLPTFTVLLLLSVGNLLGSNFEQIYVFHNALNHDRIVTLDYYAYQAGLVNFNFSLGTAIGAFKSVTSLIILFATNAVIKKVSGNSII
jgi:putative aldouronate transport system permease protein